IEGLVCVTIIGQVPHLLGIDGTSGSFFTKLWLVLQHLPDGSLAPVLTGFLRLTAMLLLRRRAPRLPGLARPNLGPAKLRVLVPGARAIVLVGYAEALGRAKAAAMQGGG